MIIWKIDFWTHNLKNRKAWYDLRFQKFFHEIWSPGRKSPSNFDRWYFNFPHIFSHIFSGHKKHQENNFKFLIKYVFDGELRIHKISDTISYLFGVFCTGLGWEKEAHLSDNIFSWSSFLSDVLVVLAWFRRFWFEFCRCSKV